MTQKFFMIIGTLRLFVIFVVLAFVDWRWGVQFLAIFGNVPGIRHLSPIVASCVVWFPSVVCLGVWVLWNIIRSTTPIGSRAWRTAIGVVVLSGIPTYAFLVYSATHGV